MRSFLIILGAAAAFAAPFAASAHPFGGAQGGARGGFGPPMAARDFGPRFVRLGPVGGWAVGAVAPAFYWDAYLADPLAFGLTPAPLGCHWIVIDNQALLIQNGTGLVIEAVML